MRMPDAVIVDVDDWAGLYIDGELKHENHSIPLRELVGYTLTEVRGLDGTDFEKWLLEHGRMPKLLSEVPDAA